jgi:hypothetical protein
MGQLKIAVLNSYPQYPVTFQGCPDAHGPGLGDFPLPTNYSTPTDISNMSRRETRGTEMLIYVQDKNSLAIDKKF